MFKYFFHKSNFNLFSYGIEQLHFSMIKKAYVLSREQIHGNPSMQEPQSRMLNVHIMGLKLANYVLTQNYSPKFMVIKTFESTI